MCAQDGWFILGLTCFLLAHCFYINEFQSRPGGRFGGVFGFLMFPLAGGLVAAFWSAIPEDLRAAVGVYAALISTMA